MGLGRQLSLFVGVCPIITGGTSAVGVDLTIYGTSPLFLVNTDAESLVLDRLDREDDRLVVAIEDRHVDLVKTAHTLARGGLYRAEAGGRSIVFRIDRFAGADELSVVSRLVPL